jgi:hypothetical protein
MTREIIKQRIKVLQDRLQRKEEDIMEEEGANAQTQTKVDLVKSRLDEILVGINQTTGDFFLQSKIKEEYKVYLDEVENNIDKLSVK